MKQNLFLTATALLAALPVLALLPGCSGGGSLLSSRNHTPTSTPTSTPTTTATSTVTPIPVPVAGTATVSFSARNGAYFGPSPYSVQDVTAQVQSNGDLFIGFAPIISGSDARYFSLSIRPAGALQSGQIFSLDSAGSNLVASAPRVRGSSDYASYGGAGFTTGSAQVTRVGDIATFVLSGVTVRDNDTQNSSNASLTFNASISVELPTSPR